MKMHRKGIAWLVTVLILVGAMGIVMPRASAQDQVWTSTADFDQGTKSQPSPADGNYEVETTTDNAQVGGGLLNLFALASLSGDEFTIDDDNADTWKWNFDLASVTYNTRRFANERFELNITGTCSPACQTGIVTNAAVSSSLDIRVTIRALYTSGVGVEYRLMISEFAEAQNGPADDGFVYRAFPNSSQTFPVIAPALDIVVSDITAGVTSDVGDVDSITGNNVMLRIVREDSTYTFYYSTTGGASWTLDETTTASKPDNLYVSLSEEISQVSEITGESQFSNYQVVAGIINSPGIRTSGDWTSPEVFIPADRELDRVVLGHTVDGTNYIDLVEILQDGSVVESFPTDITSGTSTTLTIVTVGLRGNIATRIYLAGAGTGSPTVYDVSFYYATTGDGDDGNGGPGPGPPTLGGFGSPNSVDVSYPDTMILDWLFDVPPGFLPCLNVTIRDNRPEAALAILYIWSFGDGNAAITAEGRVNHTYKEEALYVVTARVQYRGGGIEIFLVNVNTRGTECSLGEFVQEIFPLLFGLAALSVLAAIIVTTSRMRRQTRLYVAKRLLMVGAVVLLVILSISVYAYLAKIPT